MVCPFISNCGELVDFDFYIIVCSKLGTDAYKKCPKYKEITAEKRTPSKWRELLRPT